MTFILYKDCRAVVMIVCQLDLQLPLQSVPITTKVMTSNPTHGEVLYDTTLCDKVCQWFSPDIPVSSINKTVCHDITEILLKVAFKHHKPNLYPISIDEILNDCNDLSFQEFN